MNSKYITLVRAATLSIAFLLGGCVTMVLPQSDSVKAKLAKPIPEEIVAEIQQLVDDSPEHFAECISDGEKYGRALNAEERVLAKKVGITHIDKVRLVLGKRFWEKKPMWWLSGQMAHTCGYVIFSSPVGYLTHLEHEMRHIEQLERVANGNVEDWMVIYLSTQELTGYTMNPYEWEATYGKK